MIWNSLSVSVWIGATVMRVPGVDAHGSKFSMEQMMTQLSLLVAHDLHLELLPAEQGFLDEDLVHRARGRARLGHVFELLAVVGDAAAGARRA